MEPISPHTRFLQTRFFGSLDGLRALSIMAVIWLHATIVSPYYLQFKDKAILGQGGFGVDVFFTISGFLITTLLLRERQKKGQIALGEFYIRRTLRIWPLYYATLVFYVILVLIAQPGRDRQSLFFHYLPGYLTFTYTWFANWMIAGAIFNFAWSLSVEEQFYLLWAPVLRYLKPRWPPVLMFALIAVRVSAGYGWLGHVLTPGSLAERIALNISIPICLGVLLAHALHSERGFNLLYSILGFRQASPIWLVVLLACLIPAGTSWSLGRSAVLPLFVGACIVREDNGLARLLRWRPLAYIGVVSYGMYMLNTLTLDGLHPMLNRVGLLNPFLTFPLFLAMTVLVASASYRYFETPFLALKKRFASVATAPKSSAVPLI